jgi:hypothetical protein
MDARTALYTKVMQDREALRKQAAGLVGQVADLQSVLHALKYGAARHCEARRGSNDPPDRMSELLKSLEAVVDVFNDAPTLMAIASLGGGADACEKLMQSSAAAAADRLSFTKLQLH